MYKPLNFPFHLTKVSFETILFGYQRIVTDGKLLFCFFSKTNPVDILFFPFKLLKQTLTAPAVRSGAEQRQNSDYSCVSDRSGNTATQHELNAETRIYKKIKMVRCRLKRRARLCAGSSERFCRGTPLTSNVNA